MFLKGPSYYCPEGKVWGSSCWLLNRWFFNDPKALMVAFGFAIHRYYRGASICPTNKDVTTQRKDFTDGSPCGR